MSEHVEPTAAPESAPAAPYSAPEEPKKKSGVGAKVAGVLGLVLVIALVLGGLAVWRILSGEVSTAKVGDCITETVKEDASDAKVVACDKPDAKNKVIGIIPDVSEADFDAKNQDLCQEKYPTWENIIWLGDKGGKGDAWCLEPVAAK